MPASDGIAPFKLTITPSDESKLCVEIANANGNNTSNCQRRDATGIPFFFSFVFEQNREQSQTAFRRNDSRGSRVLRASFEATISVAVGKVVEKGGGGRGRDREWVENRRKIHGGPWKTMVCGVVVRGNFGAVRSARVEERTCR